MSIVTVALFALCASVLVVAEDVALRKSPLVRPRELHGINDTMI